MSGSTSDCGGKAAAIVADDSRGPERRFECHAIPTKIDMVKPLKKKKNQGGGYTTNAIEPARFHVLFSRWECRIAEKRGLQPSCRGCRVKRWQKGMNEVALVLTTARLRYWLEGGASSLKVLQVKVAILIRLNKSPRSQDCGETRCSRIGLILPVIKRRPHPLKLVS